MSGLLSAPAWQGIGAVTAIVGLVAYILVDVLRDSRRRERLGSSTVRVHEFTKPRDTAAFYRDFVAAIDGTKVIMYRSGDGFAADRGGGYHERLLDAERRALGRGVRMIRIQTGARAYPAWADGLAQLLRDFPRACRVVADFEGQGRLDFALFDPSGTRPVVVLLFSEPEPSLSTAGSRICTAIFLYHHRTVAAQLAAAFDARSEPLEPMSESDVRALGESFLYFAYGPHMKLQHMRYFVPDALRRGPAQLSGWRLAVGHTGEQERITARIEQTGDPSDTVSGVLYELSSWARGRLRTFERSPYVEVEVRPLHLGQEVQAFAFVHPLDPSQVGGPGADLQVMLEGALENHYTELARDLRRFQSGPPDGPSIPLPRTANDASAESIGGESGSH